MFPPSLRRFHFTEYECDAFAHDFTQALLALTQGFLRQFHLVNVAGDSDGAQNRALFVAPKHLGADRPAFPPRIIAGSALVLLLIIHRLAGFNDFLFVGEEFSAIS